MDFEVSRSLVYDGAGAGATQDHEASLHFCLDSEGCFEIVGKDHAELKKIDCG